MAEISMSPRVRQLLAHRNEHFDRSIIRQRDDAFYEAFQAAPGDNKQMQFAKGFANALAKKKILIEPYDILAGFSYRYTYESTMAIRMFDFDPQYRPSSIELHDKEAEDAIAALGLQPDGEQAKTLRLFAQETDHWLYKHWESGHILPGYERLINIGFGGIRELGEKALATATPEQASAIRAMLLCNEAATRYIERYRDLAQQLADEASPEDAPYLNRMAEGLAQIASGPAKTFFQAVQLIWLTHEMLYVESYPSSFSFGRIDQYLYPFYARDLAEGTLTREGAAEIIDALWIKFSTTLHTYQNLTLGGYDWENGRTDCNDLTILGLQASRKLKFEQPQVCFRYHTGLPDEVWEECVALLQTGTGFPAFFGDKACMENKMRLGIPQEDAKNFGLIGCVEMGIPGKEYGKTEVLRINWPKVLELMLQGGRCAVTDEQFPLEEQKDLASIQTFEEFYQWYIRELLHVSRVGVESINLLDRALVDCYPTPFLSNLVEGCYEHGKDITAGGAIYNNTGINGCGMANAVDSLEAIKVLVFQEKKYTLDQIAQACAANFEGYETLRQDCLRCPGYGNDNEETNQLMADLIQQYSDFVSTLSNPRGGRYQLGLYSVEDHAYMGQKTGALPDGRKAGVALANGLSPAQGRDTNGPTAVMNSILHSDLRSLANGMVLDLKFTPSFLEKPAHQAAVRAMVDTYFKRGGVEVQFNVVDRQTLLDAQQHPEEHQDLVVRVSGFSALFVTLMKTTQDDIIARTQYATL